MAITQPAPRWNGASGPPLRTTRVQRLAFLGVGRLTTANGIALSHQAFAEAFVRYMNTLLVAVFPGGFSNIASHLGHTQVACRRTDRAVATGL